LRARDRLLDGLGLTGQENLLAVGCGRGLLLIGAARRLPNGRAVGVDLWSQDRKGCSELPSLCVPLRPLRLGVRILVGSI